MVCVNEVYHNWPFFLGCSWVQKKGPGLIDSISHIEKLYVTIATKTSDLGFYPDGEEEKETFTPLLSSKSA